MADNLVPSLSARSPQDLLPLEIPQSGSGMTTGMANTKDVARMFEGMMMAQLFQAMRKTVQHSGLFEENSQARSTYEYLLDQAVVEHAMAGGRGWGLAERLETSWSKQLDKVTPSSQDKT